MKFLLVSLAFLVFSFTNPVNLIAQEKKLQFANRKKLQAFDKVNKHSLSVSGENKHAGGTLRKSISSKRYCLIIKQMEHEIILASQFLELFSGLETQDLISVEASLVDLRGQCQASFDLLRDMEVEILPKKQLLFYELIAEKFIPRAQRLLDAQWEDPSPLPEKGFTEGVLELREILGQARENYADY